MRLETETKRHMNLTNESENSASSDRFDRLKNVRAQPTLSMRKSWLLLLLVHAVVVVVVVVVLVDVVCLSFTKILSIPVLCRSNLRHFIKIVCDESVVACDS